MMRRTNLCENMNHRRSNAPVSHCPQCGEVVNANVRADPCNESRHAAARRQQAAFCMHCGLSLVLRPQGPRSGAFRAGG
jgi:hypothetical protein